jgi:DNA-binding NarL/FixJ family response regulator
MTIFPDSSTTRVFVVGRDPDVTRAISRLLDLDDGIQVVGEAETLPQSFETEPGIIVTTQAGVGMPTRPASDRGAVVPTICPLDSLRDMTLDEFLVAVKALAAQTMLRRPRHLRPVNQTQEASLASLSDREIEVVRLVAEGLSNKEISSRLTLSDKTVKNHISHILAKLNLTARTQVAVHAIRAGIV